MVMVRKINGAIAEANPTPRTNFSGGDRQQQEQQSYEDVGRKAQRLHAVAFGQLEKLLHGDHRHGRAHHGQHRHGRAQHQQHHNRNQDGRGRDAL
jgi:hypothetical protein